jgi:ribose transport system permease protein
MMTNSTDHGGAAPNVALDKFYRLYGAIGFLPIMLVGLIVLFAIFVPHFLMLPNVLNVLRSSSYLVILAVGQMLVLMVGGFDLSVGAVVALTSVSSALVMAGLKEQMADHPALIILAGVLTGLGCGFLVGLVNGLCVAFLSVSPFMVSLGTASIRPAPLLLTNGIGLRHASPAMSTAGRGLWLKLPAPFISRRHRRRHLRITNFTRMGPSTSSRSADLQAAGRSTRYLVATYVLCSVFASISGLALTAGSSGQAIVRSSRSKHRRRGDRRGEPERRRG